MPLTDIDGARLDDSALYAGKNLIINGAMQVAQRGTSSTTSGYGTCDRFRTLNNSGTVTQTQETLTSGDPYDEGFRYFIRATNTTAGSDDAAEFRGLHQYIEAQNMASSGWNYASSTSYVTLSFWARSSIGGTYYGVLRSLDGTQQGYSFGYTLSADTWTKVTHTVPGNSNITFDNNNATGLQVRLPIDLGTDYTNSSHTTETWAAWDNSNRCPDFTHDWSGTTDATFDLTGVQLEVGASDSAFEHRSYGDELAKCQRYFVKIGAPCNAFRGTSSTSFQFYVPTPVEMRTTGSVENYTSSACRMYDASGVTHSSSSLSVNSVRGAQVELNGTGFSGVTDNAIGWLHFTAELDAEL